MTAHTMRRKVAVAAICLLAACGKSAQPVPQRAVQRAVRAPQPALTGPERHVLAIGDSLFAGYDLRTEQAYPQRLEAALRAQGINAQVINAGVSGDTTADGLARLDFALASQPAPPDLVLICLGGNDMLRGLPPKQTRDNLAAILRRLEQRHITVLLMGMLAAPNLGHDYDDAFDSLYPALAKQYHAALVPFFLRAVIDRPDLQLADHLHPTPAGVEAIVAMTTRQVKTLLGRARNLGRKPG